MTPPKPVDLEEDIETLLILIRSYQRAVENTFQELSFVNPKKNAANVENLKKMISAIGWQALRASPLISRLSQRVKELEDDRK